MLEPRGRLVWVVNLDVAQTLHSVARLEPARELVKLGWEVTLLSAGPRRRHWVDGGLAIQVLKWPNVYFVKQVVYHLRVLLFVLQRWKDVDVVLLHHESSLWLLPLRLVRWVTRGSRPLFVMDIRTVPMSEATSRFRIRARFERLMFSFGKYGFDGHTAITARLADAIGLTGRRLLGVWPSGVRHEMFAAAAAGRCWPQGDEPVRLIYVGTLFEERNLHALCSAVQDVSEREGMNLVLTIVGSGPARASLEAQAAGSGGRVVVLPPVPHAEVPSLLMKAHVGVLPFPDDAIFRVSSPIKLFEYMAAGMPILASRIPCHTDVAEEGAYVFWADATDVEGLTRTLRQCWAARGELASMGAKALEAARDWTWAASARKLDEALSQAGRRAMLLK